MIITLKITLKVDFELNENKILLHCRQLNFAIYQFHYLNTSIYTMIVCVHFYILEKLYFNSFYLIKA